MSPTTIPLEKMKEKYLAAEKKITRRVILCAGTGCLANGAMKVHDALLASMKAAGVDAIVELKTEEKNEAALLVSRSGCQGFCQMGPLITILPEEIFYVKVRPEDAEEIVQTTLVEGKAVERLLYQDPVSGTICKTQQDIPFYRQQHRLVLQACGMMDPENIDEYVARGGYFAARKAWLEMTPEGICEEILRSGLRGRGGGGFPTGKKWEFARKTPGDKKYIICNGDEGDPGAFMNRSVMEGNPHAILEGMMIAAKAIGADEGYLYVRAEYPLAVKRLRRAVADAEKNGLLGDDLFGTGKRFKLQVMEGAGAFVCGEETALIASIEGHRGMPNPKPPFPVQKGLWKKPTVINNVETLADIPLILTMGATAYKDIGTASSSGTKTFALTGHVVNSGLIEIPFGATLRDIVFRIGGGVTDDAGKLTGESIKAVQIGGPSGGCLCEEHLDLPLDYDSLRGIGAMVGSGGLVVMNKKTCIVQIARFFMQFTQNESCGKCVLCREGTKQMLALLNDIIEGRATEETLPLLERLALAIQKGSLCGLGKTAPNPVLSTLRYFRSEYEAHVFQKRCPTRRCKALSLPEIDPAKCKGCTVCLKKCPVGAISGKLKVPHVIDDTKCVRCGVCAKACKFSAISGV